MDNIRIKISIVLLFTLVLTSIIVNADSEIGKDKNVKEFTLQEAIDYALNNLNSIKQLEIQIKQQEQALKKAKKEQNDTQYIANIYLPAGSGLQSLLTEKGYYKEQTRLALEELKISKEKAIENIKMGVESAYFNLKFSEEKVQIEKDNLERVQKEFDIVNQKYRLGNTTKLDILNIELQLESAKVSYQNALDDYRYSIMNFNKTIGLPLDTEVILTDKLEYIPIGEIDLETKIEEALANSYNYIKVRNSYDLAVMYKDIVGILYAKNTTYYKNAQDAVQIAEYNLEDTKTDIKLKVTKAYMDLIKAERTLNLAKKNVETTKQAYEIAKVSYETGINTTLDVSNARIALREAELGYNQALLSYNLAIKNFEMSYK